jgi:hypothetical protein
MANNNTTQPVAKPPVQTGGMRASANLAGAKGNIKSYMDARGAKPAASTGTYAGSKPPQGGGPKPPQGAGPKNPGVKSGSYGNLGKGRRMTGKPISAANRAGRAGGGDVGGPARFSDSNAVPTGGRNVNGQLGQLSQRFGAGGGGRGAAGRVQAFLDQRRQQGGQTPPTKPPTRGGGQLQGLATQMGGGKPAPSKPALSAARGALTQLQQGHSTHPAPGGGKPGMPAVKPPQGGKPGVAQTMTPPSARPPLLSGGPKPVGGGGGTTGPMRQRPKVV